MSDKTAFGASRRRRPTDLHTTPMTSATSADIHATPTAVAKGSMLNLRPSADGRFLSPVEIPGIISDSVAGRPVYVYRPAGSVRIVFFADGPILSYLATDIPGAVPAEAGRCAGDITAIAEGSAGYLNVLTEAGTELLRVTAEPPGCELLGPVPDFPPLRFEACSEMKETASCDGRRFNGIYDLHDTMLNRADSARLSDDLRLTYSSLCDLARTGGHFVQPVLARYRLYDSDGMTLHVSPTVMVTPSGGPALTGDIVIQLDDDRSGRQPFALSATAFDISLRRDERFDSPWAARVNRLVVELSHPVHPFRFDGFVPSRLERTGTGSMSIRCRMPGTSLSADTDRSVRAVTTAMLSDDDSAFRPVAVVNRPFDGDSLDIRVREEYTVGGIDTEMRTIEKLSAMAPKPRQHESRLPARLSASSVYVDGDTVITGDLSVRRAAGLSIGALTATVVKGVGWRAAVTLHSASGEIIDMSATAGDDYAPASLSPLIVSDCPDAASVTVRLMRGDKCFRMSFPLTRSADNSFSYWISPGARRVDIDTPADSFIIPARREIVGHKPGTVAAFRRGDLLNATSILETGNGRVTAIMPVGNSVSGWNAARRRFYVFTDRDIRVISLDASRRLTAIGIADNRGVASVNAVTSTSDPRRPIVAIAGRSLIALRGGKAVDIISDLAADLLPGASADEIARMTVACDGATGAVFIASASGRLKMIPDLNRPDMFTDISAFRADSMLATPEGLLMTDRHTLLDTSRQSDDLETDISVVYRAGTIGRNTASRRVAAAEIRLFSRSFDGHMAIIASDNPADFIPAGEMPEKGSRRCLLDLAVNGPVNSPMLPRVVARPFRHTAVRISGRVSADTIIAPPVLFLSETLTNRG